MKRYLKIFWYWLCDAGTDKDKYKHLRELAALTGRDKLELYHSTFYYRLSNEELLQYYKFFGRLPDPEHTNIIRHIGVANLIAEVKQQMDCVPVNNNYETTHYNKPV